MIGKIDHLIHTFDEKSELNHSLGTSTHWWGSELVSVGAHTYIVPHPPKESIAFCETQVTTGGHYFPMRTKKNHVTPRKPKIGQRVFDSMGQASAGMGVSLEAVRAAKRAGCPAFHLGGRVDEAEFLRWLKSNPAVLVASPPTSKDKKVDEEWRKLRIANDAKEKMLVPRLKVQEAIVQCATEVKRILYQRLEQEYPSAVSGLGDPAQVRVYGRRLGDEILKEFQALGERWAF